MRYLLCRECEPRRIPLGVGALRNVLLTIPVESSYVEEKDPIYRYAVTAASEFLHRHRVVGDFGLSPDLETSQRRIIGERKASPPTGGDFAVRNVSPTAAENCETKGCSIEDAEKTFRSVAILDVGRAIFAKARDIKGIARGDKPRFVGTNLHLV